MKLRTGDQRGAVLVTGMMLMAVIAMISTGAYLTTTGDLRLSAAYRDSKAALYAAEAGVQEARARLRGSVDPAHYLGDDSAAPDSSWSEYIMTSAGLRSGYTPNSIQPSPIEMEYFVEIRHKTREDILNGLNFYDGNSGAPDDNDIVYYGYGDPANPGVALQFTTSGSTEARPVQIITAEGRKGNSRKVVEVEVRGHVYPRPHVQATLYSKENITINGASGYISGVDNCGGFTSVDPVYAMSPAEVIENPAPEYDPPGSGAVTGPVDIDIDGYVEMLKPAATETITEDQNNTLYGGADDFVVAYSNTSDPYNVQGLNMRNTVGYGILIVEGDLTMSGGFEWNGLVVVTGTLTFNGGGSGVNIRGAIMANHTVDINGGLDLRYDSCMISKSLYNRNQPLRPISWRSWP